MRITVTGATGLIGRRLVAALRERDDEVTVLSRRPEDARRVLGVDAVGWQPRDASRRRSTHSQVATASCTWPASRSPNAGRTRARNAFARAASSAPRGSSKGSSSPSRVHGSWSAPPPSATTASVATSASTKTRSPGTGFLASVCEAWERAAAAAARLGVRTVSLRTGVLLDRDDGALARMLPPFRLGVGGPVAGGNQYISWIAPDDLVRLYLAALDDPEWSGPVNATAPEPVTNRRIRTRARSRAAPPRATADPRLRAADALR